MISRYHAAHPDRYPGRRCPLARRSGRRAGQESARRCCARRCRPFAPKPAKDGLEIGFGLWARHGCRGRSGRYERRRRAEWTRPWDEDYDEVRAESPELFTEEDDRERAHYLELSSRRRPGRPECGMSGYSLDANILIDALLDHQPAQLELARIAKGGARHVDQPRWPGSRSCRKATSGCPRDDPVSRRLRTRRDR